MVFQERATQFVPQHDIDHALDFDAVLPLVSQASNTPAQASAAMSYRAAPSLTRDKLGTGLAGASIHFAPSLPDALFVGLMAFGIKPDDEVVIPALAPLSVAQAVLLAGARPIFADVQPDLPLASDAAIEAAITEKTKLVIVSHLGGLVRDCRHLAESLAARNIGLFIEASDALPSLLQVPQSLDHCDLAVSAISVPSSHSAPLAAFLVTHHEAMRERLKSWSGMNAQRSQMCLLEDDLPCINLLEDLEENTDMLLSHELDMQQDAYGLIDQQISHYQALLGKKRDALPDLSHCLGYCTQTLPMRVAAENRDSCQKELRESGFRLSLYDQYWQAFRIYSKHFCAQTCPNACDWIDRTIGLPTGSLLGIREQRMMIELATRYL